MQNHCTKKNWKYRQKLEIEKIKLVSKSFRDGIRNQFWVFPSLNIHHCFNFLSSAKSHNPTAKLNTNSLFFYKIDIEQFIEKKQIWMMFSPLSLSHTHRNHEIFLSISLCEFYHFVWRKKRSWQIISVISKLNMWELYYYLSII